MNFVSTEFVVFLLVTWGLFLVSAPRYGVPLLTAARYVFYATGSIPFIAVILFTTAIDYLASKSILTNASPAWRKAVMWVAIGVNLVVLGFFKYFNFFLDSNHQLLQYIGLPNPLPPHRDILLPLGISYYTFEAISYLVDVYCGGKPAPSWWDYSFYIMYFPHLIAGPIVRFNELWPQYSRPLTVPSLERIQGSGADSAGLSVQGCRGQQRCSHLWSALCRSSWCLSWYRIHRRPRVCRAVVFRLPRLHPHRQRRVAGVQHRTAD